MRNSPGDYAIEVSGQDLSQLFQEAGNHRLQRVPPTERRGRVHTSSIVVAVLEASQFDVKQVSLKESDLKIEWYSGTGCGGQHRNKHQNSVRLTHIPTGILETAQCRSRADSLKQASDRLVERLQHASKRQAILTTSIERKRQMGSGQRADNKVRTYRFQDDIAADPRTDKKVNLSKVMGGYFDLLW